MEHVDISSAVKHHWKAIVGGLFGVLVLFFLLSKLKSGSSASSTGSTSAEGQVLQYASAASLTNAQFNAQEVTAQLQASVATQGIAAGLQSDLAKTAAQLAATQQQTTAATAVALDTNRTAISLQTIKSEADLNKTAIEGQVVENLATQASAVKMQSLQVVQKQVNTILKYSKHTQADLQKFAPIIALETGQGSAASSIASTNAQVAVATSTGTQVAQVAGGITSVIGALFG